MPLFEYVCRDCQQEFETLLTAHRPPACPSCHGQELEKQLSVFAVSTKGGATSRMSSQAPTMGGCGSCGDPRGPGSCSIN